ncbi:MAG: hypothetical protein Q9159_005792 [Coniocarpon cinnabarinum]
MSTNSFLARILRPFTTGTARFGPAEAGQRPEIPDTAQKCTVAAGCFWGVEHLYRKNFDGKGLLDARVGYIGGDTSNPSYRAVCTGRTGHAEALQMFFDPEQLSYRTLIEFLYRMHDPTTANRQGPDVGSQYRSGIFYHDDEQKAEAEKITRQVQQQWFSKGQVTTEVLPAGQWWDAEDYHQKYLDINPGGYECPSHFIRSFPPLKDDEAQSPKDSVMGGEQ